MINQSKLRECPLTDRVSAGHNGSLVRQHNDKTPTKSADESHRRSETRASPNLPPELGPSLAVDENGARLQHLPKLRQNLRLQDLQNPSCKPRCYNLSQLPGPTRQSLPLQRRRKCVPRRSHRTQHDDWQTHSAGYFVLAVQGYGGVEVR